MNLSAWVLLDTKAGCFITVSVCLGCLSNLDICFLVRGGKFIPALMWVVTSSIEVGEAVSGKSPVIVCFCFLILILAYE